MKKLKWEIVEKKIVDLILAEYNPRKLSVSEKKQLRRSIDKFGFVEPIVVNYNNVVIGGHQRLKLLKESGIENVMSSTPNRLLNEQEEKELNLRLNKNTGDWNIDLLLSNFDDILLQDVGFTVKDLKVDFGINKDECKQKEINSIFQVLVECDNEITQEEVFNFLKEHGYKARVISL